MEQTDYSFIFLPGWEVGAVNSSRDTDFYVQTFCLWQIPASFPVCGNFYIV